MTTLQEKLDSGLSLNVGELVKATGYGRRALKRMSVPLVEGRITLKAFEAHVEAKRNEGYALLAATVIGASPERSNGSPQREDKSNEPHTWNVQLAASRLRVGCQPHSNGSRK